MSGEVYELWWSDGRPYVPDPPLRPWTPNPPIHVPTPPTLVLKPIQVPEAFQPEPEPPPRSEYRCQRCGELSYAVQPPLCAECHERDWRRHETRRAGGLRRIACDRFIADPRQYAYKLSWGSRWSN